MSSEAVHFKYQLLRLFVLGWFLSFSNLAFSDQRVHEFSLGSTASEDEPEMLSVHTQATYIVQQKNNFSSPYYGQNSLLNNSEGGGKNSYTFSSTAFLGARLWEGAEAYFNPEMFQGIPFSGELVGLGGFQNGELQKGAFSSPTVYTARAFLRQTFDLEGEKSHIESSANQLGGKKSQNRLVMSYGKFATLDFFDQNIYSHDAHTQFQNFAIFSMGAYSYAADTKGYTYGAVIEWYQNDWIFKGARLALPTVPNTQKLDFSLRKDYIDQIELTHQHEMLGKPGALRAIYYRQYAYMGNYQNANAQALPIPDITGVRQNGTQTWGYGVNLEQKINNDIGIFARWSWNPGTVETQTLDISRSLSGGMTMKGSSWARANDTVGIGFAVNGISGSQVSYLQHGGMSPFIGDGALSYKKEQILETYYSAKVAPAVHVTFDYQHIANPAYNAARGPVNFYGVRLHVEI